MHMQRLSQNFDKFSERVFFWTLKQTVKSCKSMLGSCLPLHFTPTSFAVRVIFNLSFDSLQHYICKFINAL